MNKRIFFAPLVSLMLFCIFSFVAFILPIVNVLCPILLMLFGAFSLFKNSKITLYTGTLVAVAISCAVSGAIVYSIVYALGFVAAGFVLCYSLLTKKGGAHALISVLVCLLVANYGSVALSDLFAGKQAFSFVDEMFKTLKPVIVEAINNVGTGLKPENVEIIFRQYETLVRMLLPAMIIIIGLFETIILSFLVKVIVNKTIGTIVVDLKFSRFKADGTTVFVFLLSAIISMFAGDSIIAVVFSNIYMILNVVLFLCGLSLFDWYLKDVKKIRFGFRVLIFMLVGISFVFPILPLLFTVAALVDARRNFRFTEEDS